MPTDTGLNNTTSKYRVSILTLVTGKKNNNSQTSSQIESLAKVFTPPRTFSHLFFMLQLQMSMLSNERPTQSSEQLLSEMKNHDCFSKNVGIQPACNTLRALVELIAVVWGWAIQQFYCNFVGDKWILQIYKLFCF